jgi:hypothetical protein
VHEETSVQVTWQVPVQSASQLDTLVQRMVLPAPARTPHVEVFSHEYVHRSPQMAPHDDTLWQSRLQSFPHDAVQSGTSWHTDEQSLPHTVPHVLPTLWQSCAQPSPVQPRKHSSPPEHTHESPGLHPSVLLQSTTPSAAESATASAAVVRPTLRVRAAPFTVSLSHRRGDAARLSVAFVRPRRRGPHRPGRPP